ncbi:MAG: ATP-binding protein [Kiritimatiellae bacterium]|nr:ATP-binding protein [Kiritimatiellia bacterium]MDD5520677.1 ATP-binding protein [Kiritimatiellia bacterium]
MTSPTINNTLGKVFTGNVNLLDLLMDNLPEILFLKDRNLRFVQTNEAHAAIMGLSSPDEVIGKTDFDLFPALDVQSVHEQEEKVIKTGQPVFSLEQKISNSCGETCWLCGHRIPIKDEKGDIIGLLGLIRNISPTKKMEQELRDVNMRLSHALTQLKQTQQKIIQHERLNALGEMASGVAHDFNNALMPILGYTDVLIAKPEILVKTEETLGMLKDIRMAAMDAAQAVRRLREFYRMSSEEEKYKGNLNKQVETAVILTRPKWQSEMGAKGIHISVKTELQDIPMVNAKESQLREILINLILNAVDAMPDGGTITLNTRKEHNMVVLEVCDTGMGMTDDVRHRCFEPFFTTKGDAGTGLGLSMAYGFAKRQNGTIDIISAPGKGTKVAICLPTEEAEVLEPPVEIPAFMIPQMRILVIDDEPYACKLFNMYLKADKHIVDIASNGKDGMAKFSSGSYDFVITDRAMPDMSGDQVAAAIREVNNKIPIIMVTGFGDIMNENKECPEGVDVVLCKPVTRLEFQNAIARALAIRGKT